MAFIENVCEAFLHCPKCLVVVMDEDNSQAKESVEAALNYATVDKKSEILVNVDMSPKAFQDGNGLLYND